MRKRLLTVVTVVATVLSGLQVPVASGDLPPKDPTYPEPISCDKASETGYDQYEKDQEILGGLENPGAEAEIPAEEPPEFGSPQCGGWQADDFQYYSEGNSVLFHLSRQGWRRLQDQVENNENPVICFPDKASPDSAWITVADFRFVESFGQGKKGISVLRWPSHLETVVHLSFKGKKLKSIAKWPPTLKVIETGAFASNGLTSIPKFPDSLTRIENGAFASNAITSIPNWPASLEKIGAEAFFNNEIVSLPETWPSGVVEIKEKSFANNKIKKISSWPPKLRSIGIKAFLNNEIESLPPRWPDSLTQLYDEAFHRNKLSEISSWPKNLITICHYVFADNNLQALVDWPKDLATIGNYSFAGNNIKEIPSTWPVGLVTLGYSAFANDEKLYPDKRNQIKVIPDTWPDTLAVIGNAPFFGNLITRFPRKWPTIKEFTYLAGVYLNNLIECVAYLQPKNKVVLRRDHIFSGTQWLNRVCLSSYTPATVVRGEGSEVSTFIPGVLLIDRRNLNGCRIKNGLPGVTFTETGEKNCDFKVSATSKAALGQQNAVVEITPKAGDPYEVDLPVTVVTTEQPTPTEPNPPEKESGGDDGSGGGGGGGGDDGRIIGGGIGGFMLLLFGWIFGSCFLTPRFRS